MTSNFDPLHTYSRNSELVLERIKHLPVGGRMKDIPQELWHQSYVRTGKKKTGGPNLRLLRLDPELPSNTITAYVFNKFVHPVENRYITPREAARLQQFPDTHSFAGSITDAQLQIGNAVPVGLAQAVAKHVAARFERTTKGLPKALSLFAGAGGMDLGFSSVFDIEAAVELIPVFAETLRRNFPNVEVLNEDINVLRGPELTGNRVDVVFGGPPCQPFSAAGRHGGLRDERGRLVGEFMRVVSETLPRFFVMENVPGLVSNAGGGAISYIYDMADSIGYQAEHFILTATDYGVPQSRRRLFVIGRRDDEPALGRPLPTHAKPGVQGDLLLAPCASVGDAFGGLGIARRRDLLTLQS